MPWGTASSRGSGTDRSRSTWSPPFARWCSRSHPSQCRNPRSRHKTSGTAKPACTRARCSCRSRHLHPSIGCPTSRAESPRKAWCRSFADSRGSRADTLHPWRWRTASHRCRNADIPRHPNRSCRRRYRSKARLCWFRSRCHSSNPSGTSPGKCPCPTAACSWRQFRLHHRTHRCHCYSSMRSRARQPPRTARIHKRS